MKIFIHKETYKNIIALVIVAPEWKQPNTYLWGNILKSYIKKLTRTISQIVITFYFLFPKLFLLVFAVSYNWHVIAFMILKTNESYKNTKKVAPQNGISWLLIHTNHLAHWITKWSFNHFQLQIYFPSNSKTYFPSALKS